MQATSAKDRTDEFNKIVERLRRSQGTSTASLPPSAPAQAEGSTKQEFASKAQGMSVRISELAGRIGELTRLARQSTMFEDNTPQINALTAQVKQGLQSMNQELQSLQALSGKAAASKQGGSHSNRVVDSLRVQLNSTTENFKSVLEVRRDALQASEARRNLFASSVAPANQFAPGASFFDDTAATGPSHANAQENATEQTQLVTTAPQADSYLQSRETAIHQITQDIQGLSSMFGQLAMMVQEQGEMALRIDDNVDNVVSNVDAAQVQLLKYLQTISNNRWLALKVFGVLLVFILLFIFVS